MIWFEVAAAAVWLLFLARVGLVIMRMFQLEEYDAQRLFRWAVHARPFLCHRAFVATATVGGVGWLVLEVSGRGSEVGVAWLIAGVAGNALWKWMPEKKPLVYTSRARRLLVAALLVTAVFTAGLTIDVTADPWAVACMLGVVLAPLWTVVLLVAGNVMLWPYELWSRRQFRLRARRKLDELGPTVVAVAGSYGKTTTKRLIAHAVDQDGDTLPTPKSFNTLLGLTKTVNDELSAQHHVFVAEMDAYNPGEIAQMCRLVRPRISVLTSVGAQHLERFGTIDRIADALFEVVEGLSGEGTAIIYCGDELGEAVAHRAKALGKNTISYATEDENREADMIACDVQVLGTGTRFKWSWPAKGLQRDVEVSLLGRHQVLNASAALAVAHCLGRDLDQAVRNLADAPQVEHRLQIVPTGNGVTVIDDSYNANPVGVHNALEVLRQMDVRRRVLVTPGVVELGSHEDDENRRYGEHAGRVCSDVIIVKARTTPALVAGVRASGMSEEHLHVVGSLEEATATIGRITAAGDAVLFANDLPDTY